MSSHRFHRRSDSWLRTAAALAPSRRPRPARKLAGVITVLAVGVGLALGRSELERRRSNARRASRKFALRKGESLALGLPRIALGQLDLAIELVEDPPAGEPERAIHDIRKAIKRLRALLRLARPAIGKRRLKVENRALRDCARRLARARDSEVALITLEELIDADPDRLAGSPALESLRARLRAQREAALRDSPLAAENRLLLLGELRAVRARVGDWALTGAGRGIVEDGLKDIYRTGRRELRHARKKTNSVTLHQWRKRVKDLRYAAQILGGEKGTHKSKTRKLMGPLAARADHLAEVLGQEHDLAQLSAELDRHADLFSGERRTRKRLQKLIAKRRRRLCKEAFRRGERLYESSPQRFTRRASRALRSR